MTDHREALRTRLAAGCCLPEARDHASLLLAIADRRAAERERYDLCASGCTAPVVVTEPEPLCASCARRMGA